MGTSAHGACGDRWGPTDGEMEIDSGVGGEGRRIQITTYTPVEIIELFAATLMTRGVGGDAHHDGQGPCQGAQRKGREGLDVTYLLHHSAYQLTKTHGVINTTPVYGGQGYCL